MRLVSFLHGKAFHHIDHLASISILLDIPLMVTEEAIFRAINKFYPITDITLCDRINFSREIDSDRIISTYPKSLLAPLFVESKIKSIWLPHGNSDKNNLSHLREDIALTYGDIMSSKLSHKIKKLHIGNFRKEVYLRNKSFFDSINVELTGKKTILFAPSWESKQRKIVDELCDKLPEEYNLIIKLHPNTLEREFISIENRPNVILLGEFPLIYPLFTKSDIFLGDRSSVGYDFLSEDKPIFLLNGKGDLSQVSINISTIDEFFSLLSLEDKLSSKRRELLKRVFAKVNYKRLNESLEDILC